MTKRNRRAVCAGLALTCAVINPQVSYALTLDEVASNPLTQLAAVIGGSFVVGAGIGWVITKVFMGENHEAMVSVDEVACQPTTAEVKVERKTMKVSELEHKVASYKPKHMRSVDASHNVKTSDLEPAVAKSSNHQATSLEDIAQNYARKEELKTKHEARRLGVAGVLAKRLGFDAQSLMEGIPVIQRADGTVGDVGTSWWDEAVEGQRRSGEGFSDYLQIEKDWTAAHAMSYDSAAALGSTAASLFCQVKPEANLAHKSNSTDTVSRPQSADSQESATYTSSRYEMIANRVPEVFREKFPETHQSKEDVWAAALDAMEEKIEFASPIEFNDFIGDESTLDDPDGLEPQTEFIPFKAPAGHPEVVDTDSYIDYLISSEFARHASRSVRKNAREYLKVIEGGTSEVKMYVPEHFKRAQEA